MASKTKTWEILFIDDDEDDYVLVRDMLADLKRVSAHVVWTATYQNAMAQLKSNTWDAVLVDYDLGQKTGIQLIREALAEQINIPFIMVTGRGSYELDIEAMQAGAYDYLSKCDLTPVLLERVIRYAIERQKAEQELEQRVLERTEELSTALEEMQIVEDEMRSQVENSLNSKIAYEQQIFRYKDLFEKAPIAYILTNSDATILETNELAASLFNCEPKYLKGKPLSVFVDDQIINQYRSRVNELINQKKSVNEWQLRIKPRDRPVEEVRVIVSPIRSTEDDIQAIRWLIIPQRKSELG